MFKDQARKFGLLSNEFCDGIENEALESLEKLETKAAKYDEFNTQKKANASKIQKVSYGDSDDSGWTIPLVCPVCTENVGEIMDDDGYFIMSKRCGGCGQAIQQTYTEEEIDEWYKERDQNEKI